MDITGIISGRYNDFVTLCKTHKVSRLYAFGSSVTGGFNPETSDIDIIVRLEIEDPVIRGQMLISLWDDLELFFGKKVDLLTEDSVRNPYLRKSISETKKLIYDEPLHSNLKISFLA